MQTTFQQRYLSLVAEIEQRFRVAQWTCGDLDLWPVARMDLFLDMHWAFTGQQPAPRAHLLRRLLAVPALPLTNAWRRRRDLKHWAIRPRHAHAVLLGDGVSLDRVNGAWQDRFGEPIIAELERAGLQTFVMQQGDPSRAPWRRPTFAANVLDVWSRAAGRVWPSSPDLPDHENVIAFLRAQGIVAPSLERAALARRASAVLIAARMFERILARVKPRIAFVVTFYAGLGPAFLLACRRRKILSVDLQHCPQEGAHKAYGWSNLPAQGYSALPAVFWNWSRHEADDITRWTALLAAPRHRSLHGGNTQIAALHASRAPCDQQFTREILVALQPIAGQTAAWDALADVIEASPAQWRWWIRRHPSSRPYQDAAFGRLLALRRDNVVSDAATEPPLPLLLPRMSVLVSLMSGAAVEAAMFGVPAIFLSREAQGTFASLIDRGDARIVDVAQLHAAIADLPPRMKSPNIEQPDLGTVLRQLDEFATDYHALIAQRPA